MSETITATGIVATDPRCVRTGDSLEITSFRLASSQRRYNKSSGSWEYTDSNWFTVTAFRRLARNAAESLRKGDRVIVTGRLRITAWKNDERSGTKIEIDADSIGHDLNWGTSTFSRSAKPDAAEGGQAPGGGAPDAEPGETADPFPSAGPGWFERDDDPAAVAATA